MVTQFSLKNLIMVSFIILINHEIVLAQPDTLWTRTYGTGVGNSVQQTSDAGYIITGKTPLSNTSTNDARLIKVDALGDTLWTRIYGGSGAERGNSVQQTSDGGYIIAGETYSHGSNAWLVKTDASGDTLWTKSYGGNDWEKGHFVQQTADGGYIVTGFTRTYSSGSYDVWLVKTNASGDILWTKAYGGSGDDSGKAVQQTPDGGYVITGWTTSYGAGGYDFWLIKTDLNGDTLWTRTYGGNQSEHVAFGQQTSDGGYILTGSTADYGRGRGAWLVKTDILGDTLWTKTFMGSGGSSVQQTFDGGYIIAAGSYLMRTDALGDTLWTMNFAGGSGRSVQQTSDGGYIITGTKRGDVWLVRVQGDPREGIVTKWYENGLKKSEGNYKEYKKDGLWSKWYLDGKKKLEENYKEGKRDGKHSQWYANGHRKTEKSYKNGQLEGKQTEWYEDGQKCLESVYVAGKQDGKHTSWYANGQTKEDGFYKEGLMNGEWTYYHENGVVKGKGHFINGDGTDIYEISGIPRNGKDGRWVYHYENGQKWSIENYKEGRKHGPDITWYENGKKHYKVIFKDGKRDGKHSQWYENGNKMLEITLKDGKEHGKLTQWYENGQIMVKSTFINGEETGSFTFWYENGQIRTEGVLKAGLTDGEWTRYYENGVIKWSGHYVGVDIANLGEDWGSSINGRNGLWIFNYENGKRLSKQTYKDGQLEGLYTELFDNGEKKYEGNYSNGRIVGEWTFWNEQGTVKEDLSKLVTNYLKAKPGLRTFKIVRQGSAQMGDMISTNITGEVLVDLDEKKCRISATQESPEFGGMLGADETSEVYLTDDAIYLFTFGEMITITDEEIRTEAGIGLDSLWSMIEAQSPDIFIDEEPDNVLSISESERSMGIGTDLDLLSHVELSEVVMKEKPCYLLTVDSSYASELSHIIGRFLETEGDASDIQDQINVSDFIRKRWISKETFYDMMVYTKISFYFEGVELGELGPFFGEEEKLTFSFEETVDISEHNQPIEITNPIAEIKALIGSVIAGDTTAIEELLAKGTDVNARNTDGQTTLMIAALNGNIAVVQTLLKAGADVNSIDNWGRTSLMWSIFNGRNEIVRILLDAGADIHATGMAEQTALTMAVDRGHTTIVQTLLAAGADANSKFKRGYNKGLTVLMSAAKVGNAAMVHALLEAGADVNAKDPDSRTALMSAALGGHIATIESLLEDGADINAIDKDGQTALSLAASSDHADVVQILEKAGAKK